MPAVVSSTVGSSRGTKLELGSSRLPRSSKKVTNSRRSSRLVQRRVVVSIMESKPQSAEFLAATALKWLSLPRAGRESFLRAAEIARRHAHLDAVTPLAIDQRDIPAHTVHPIAGLAVRGHGAVVEVVYTQVHAIEPEIG